MNVLISENCHFSGRTLNTAIGTGSLECDLIVPVTWFQACY